jgi:hypothetical protein
LLTFLPRLASNYDLSFSASCIAGCLGTDYCAQSLLLLSFPIMWRAMLQLRIIPSWSSGESTLRTDSMKV